MPVVGSTSSSSSRFSRWAHQVQAGAKAAGVRVHRVLRGNPMPPSHKAIELSFKPLLPLIIAGSGLLYHQGQQANQPGGGEKNAWLRVLTESGLACLVLQSTSGVYPLFGLGMAAYKSGKETTTQGKVQALIDTAVNLSLGYGGYRFFDWMSALDERMDDEFIHETFQGKNQLGVVENTRRQQLNRWVNQLKNQTEPSLQTLGLDIEQLKAKLAQKMELLNDSPANAERLQMLQAELNAHKAAISTGLEEFGDQALHGLADDAQKPIKSLLGAVEYSQSGLIKSMRAMNPVFGYIILGMLVGNPLSKWIGSWFEQRNPQLKNKQFNVNLFPPQNRFLSVNGHRGGHGVGSVDGPTMIWPSVMPDGHTAT